MFPNDKKGWKEAGCLPLSFSRKCPRGNKKHDLPFFEEFNLSLPPRSSHLRHLQLALLQKCFGPIAIPSFPSFPPQTTVARGGLPGLCILRGMNKREIERTYRCLLFNDLAVSSSQAVSRAIRLRWTSSAYYNKRMERSGPKYDVI